MNNSQAQRREELAIKYHEAKNHFSDEPKRTKGSIEKFKAIEKARKNYCDLMDDPFLTERRCKVLKQPTYLLQASMNDYWNQIEHDEVASTRNKKLKKHFLKLVSLATAIYKATEFVITKGPRILSYVGRLYHFLML